MGVMLFLVQNLKKNSLKLNTASYTTTSRCTDTDGSLEHSPTQGSLYYKGPTLQKIIPVLGGPLTFFQRPRSHGHYQCSAQNIIYSHESLRFQKSLKFFLCFALWFHLFQTYKMCVHPYKASLSFKVRGAPAPL